MPFFPPNFMLHTPHQDDHQDFQGSGSFLGKRTMSFSGMEAERKMQLARALGLQPRQIAIWFHNRRATWKTKQLEKDYDILKRQFEAVKAENDSLLAHNHKLHAEIMTLKNVEKPTEISINLNKETEGSSSNRSENSSEIMKLDISMRPAAIDSPILVFTTHQPITRCSRLLFPPPMRPNGVSQLFHSSRQQVLQSNMKLMDQTVKEETLSNILCAIGHGLSNHTSVKFLKNIFGFTA